MQKMKKNGLNIIAFISILLCLLISLSGCSSTTQQENDLNQKLEEEIRYLDDKIVSMLNKLNHIQYKGYMITEEQNETSDSKNTGSNDSNSDNSQGSSSEGKASSGGESSSSGSSSEGSSSQSQEGKEGSGGYTKYGVKETGILTGEQKQIDWSDLKNTIESLYSTWTTILVDLHSAQIENQDILNFSTLIDQTITAIKKEDKQQTLVLLTNLYAYLPKYTEQYTKDTNKTNVLYTKYYILSSYVLLEQDKWDEMQNAISQAQTYFSNLINKVSDNQENQTQLSKIYVLLNEMNGAISVKDKDVYYIKYKTLMENISRI